LIKLMELEWRKLERTKVIGEVIFYWVIMMFLPVFFIKVVFAELPTVDFGDSYAAALDLMLLIQAGNLLFGASLINHVFIEEYKNKTIALSFGYPLSRQKLVMAKVLFIAVAVFCCTLVSFLLAGVTTYAVDQVQDVISGVPTLADLLTYAARMIIHSIMIALASLIPLFAFGLWIRLVIPTVICAIVLMQLPTIFSMLRITVNTDLLYSILSILGVASAVLSVKLVNKVGDL